MVKGGWLDDPENNWGGHYIFNNHFNSEKNDILVLKQTDRT